MLEVAGKRETGSRPACEPGWVCEQVFCQKEVPRTRPHMYLLGVSGGDRWSWGCGGWPPLSSECHGLFH